MTPEQQVAACLFYLASGCDFVRASAAVGWSKTSVHRCVKEVTSAIFHVLGPVHVKLPSTKEEFDTNVLGFQSFARGKWVRNTPGIPQVWGAMDGSHIPIKKPAHSGDAYINRKGFFSINMHAVCDHNAKFMDVYVGNSGRNHDVDVLHQSPFWSSLQNGALGESCRQNARTLTAKEYNGSEVEMVVPLMVIADAAYVIGPYVLPAFKEGESTISAQRLVFQNKHKTTRNVVERAFGVLKNRWRCLLTPMQLDLAIIPTVVSACVVLHNICIEYREADPTDDEDFQQLIEMYNDRYAVTEVAGYNVQQSPLLLGDREIGKQIREFLIKYVNTQ